MPNVWQEATTIAEACALIARADRLFAIVKNLDEAGMSFRLPKRRTIEQLRGKDPETPIYVRLDVVGYSPGFCWIGRF